MLCEFKFKEEITSTMFNASVDPKTNETILEPYEITESVYSTPSILQYVISFWVFTFLCEEIRQVQIFFSYCGDTAEYFMRILREVT